MDTTEIIVVVAGVALIAFVLCYFFGEHEPGDRRARRR